MAREQLAATTRNRTGKNVKALRRDGFTPAVVYGVNAEPINIKVPTNDFLRLLRQGKEAELLDLMVDDRTEPVVVLINDIQEEPLRNAPLHIDFYEPDLTQPVDVEVELELVGESSAIEEKRGVLLQVLNELPIRVLPTHIPASIPVDISPLNEVGDGVTINDITIPEGVEVMVEDEETLIVKIEALRTVEEIEAEEADAEAQAAEAAEGEEGEEGEEGSTSAEGDDTADSSDESEE